MSNETEGERIIASTSGNLPPDQVAAPGTTLAKRGRPPKNSKNNKKQTEKPKTNLESERELVDDMFVDSQTTSQESSSQTLQEKESTSEISLKSGDQNLGNDKPEEETEMHVDQTTPENRALEQ